MSQMKPDKHKQKEKRIIWLKNRRDDLYEFTDRFVKYHNNENLYELPKPIHRGYWGDFVPASIYYKTEREKVINEVLDACFKSQWSRTKNFNPTKKEWYYYNHRYYWERFNDITKEKYKSLSPQAQRFFKVDWIYIHRINKFHFYYRPLINNIRQHCEWKITKSYITHIHVPYSNEIRELDEVEKELYDLQYNPWGKDRSRWSKSFHSKLKSKVRAKTTKLIKTALNTKDFEVLDELANSNKPYKYWS